MSAGCSTLGSGQSSRKVPLPPNVDASDLFNTRPADGAVADATPYYKKDDDEKLTASALADVKANARTRQAAAGEKVAPSEVAVKEYRAAERNQPKRARAAEANRKLAELEQRRLYNDEDFERATPEVRAFILGYDSDEPEPFLSPEEYTRRRADLAAQAAADAKPGARYNILILSGGVAHGAYQAGVLCGWSDGGCRPKFDVVTGVSTGALVAAAVFPGDDYNSELRRFYTTVSQKPLRGDIWRIKALPPLGIGTDSAATNEPLRRLVRQVIHSPGYFEKVAAEHAKGRRLYVGTTNLDTQRFVVWDMGAIASEGTAESRKLYEDVLAGSAAMPPLLSPSHITITVDGKRYDEMHVDGGTTRNLFFYPPSDWPGEAEDKKTGYRMLAGANVYVVVAGKVYNDPEGTNPKLFSVGFRSLGTLLAALQRAELARVYSHCLDREMEFKLAAIPGEYSPLFPASTFDPEKMTALFLEGIPTGTGRAGVESGVARAGGERGPRPAAAPT